MSKLFNVLKNFKHGSLDKIISGKENEVIELDSDVASALLEQGIVSAIAEIKKEVVVEQEVDEPVKVKKSSKKSK